MAYPTKDVMIEAAEIFDCEAGMFRTDSELK